MQLLQQRTLLHILLIGPKMQQRTLQQLHSAYEGAMLGLLLFLLLLPCCVHGE